MTVPNTFANATTAIPLVQLDQNFNTGVTLGNTTVFLGNTTNTLGNVTFTGANVSSGTISGSTSINTTGTVAAGNTTITGTISATGASNVASISFGGSSLSTYTQSQAWTPNQGSGLTVVGAFSSSGTYTRVGNMVTVNGVVSGATSVAVTAVGDICSNLPFGAGGTTIFFGGAVNNGFSVFCLAITSTARLISTSSIGASPNIYFSITYTV